MHSHWTPQGVDWESTGSKLGADWDSQGVDWEWPGSRLGVQWESQGVEWESQGVHGNPWGSVIYSTLSSHSHFKKPCKS